jgi:hypothetical protein
MMQFGIGELVYFHDLDGKVYLSVVLEEGVFGYGGDTRVIYVIYSIANQTTWIAYESELHALNN